MVIDYYVADVFTQAKFGGNPAGVCILDKEIPMELCQNIAFENKLSETAFVLKKGDAYELKWFTPEVEVELCGHATLASAFVLSSYYNDTQKVIKFSTLSGIITAEKKDDMFWLDFPSRPVQPVPQYSTFSRVFKTECYESYKANDFLLVFDDPRFVAEARPDFNELRKIQEEAVLPNNVFGIIISAAGTRFDCDFISRFFAPNAGVDEDPVTGRAHCSLTPYWSQRLNKASLVAKQISQRGGIIHCNFLGERVELGGNAIIYSKGQIFV